MADSVATYLQEQDHSNTQSQCTSTEVIATSGGTGGTGGTCGSGSGYGGVSSSTDHITTPTKSNGCIIDNLHQHSAKVIMRSKRRNSDRPWSVSCLSQLQQQNGKENTTNEKMNTQQGLANHSISESALDILSSPNVRHSKNIQTNSSTLGKVTESKNSLKRRRLRSRKRYSGGGGSGSGNVSLSIYYLICDIHK